MPDKTTDMDAYKQSGAYQSLGIDKLQEQLAGYQTDDASLRQQAEAQYKPTYDTQIEALRQQTAQQIQGYQGQLAGLGTAYDQQRRQANEGYDQSILSASNALTRRGLGRSSLVATQGAYLEKQRNQTLADINANQNAAVNAINEKIALLTEQAAQSEKTMAGSYAAQIEARMNELRQHNQSAATNLQLQITALQQQGYQAYLDKLNADRNYELAQREQQLAEDQFAYTKEQNAKKSSGGGSSSSSVNPVPAPEAPPSSDDIFNKLLGNGIPGAKELYNNATARLQQVVQDLQQRSKRNTTTAAKTFKSAVKK